MFRRRIGVVVVFEDGLGEHVKKKLFSHKKKNSLLDDNKYWILVSLLGKCTFSDPFLNSRYQTGRRAKSIRRSKRVATRKQKIENQNNTMQKFKREYPGFIPPDLTKMVVSWENINLFEWNEKCSWLKWVLQMQWNNHFSPEKYGNGKEPKMKQLGFMISIYNGSESWNKL